MKTQSFYFEARLTVLPGSCIGTAIDEAILIATKLDMPVNFKFNGVRVFVDKNSDRDKELADYLRRLKE